MDPGGGAAGGGDNNIGDAVFDDPAVFDNLMHLADLPDDDDMGLDGLHEVDADGNFILDGGNPLPSAEPAGAEAGGGAAAAGMKVSKHLLHLLPGDQGRAGGGAEFCLILPFFVPGA